MDEGDVRVRKLRIPPNLENRLCLDPEVLDDDRQNEELAGHQVDDGQVLLGQVRVLPHVRTSRRVVSAGQNRDEETWVGARGGHAVAGPAR